MKQPTINHTIDWLECTSHKMKYEEKLVPLAFDIGDIIKPRPHYTKAFATMPAGRLDISDDERTGVHWTMTGSDLRTAREAGITTEVMLGHTVWYGATFSRLDFAVDIHHDASDPDHPRVSDVRLHVKNNWHEGIAHDTGYVPPDDTKGQTEYFGARSSKNRIRIYDKAKETGLLWDCWVRIELQSRDKPATLLARDMVKNGVSPVGATKIKKLLRFPFLHWYNHALETDRPELTAQPKNVPLWQRWMNTQVKASVKNHLKNDDDRQFFIEWCTELLKDAYALDRDNVGYMAVMQELNAHSADST